MWDHTAVSAAESDIPAFTPAETGILDLAITEGCKAELT